MPIDIIALREKLTRMADELEKDVLPWVEDSDARWMMHMTIDELRDLVKEDASIG